MAKGITLPDIPEHEQTPVIKLLLGIIEELIVTVQRQEEEIQQLKDEVAILKGEKKRPKFKPSKLDKDMRARTTMTRKKEAAQASVPDRIKEVKPQS